MANLIQIKRSLSTATPTSLANGEMAFSANGDNLFIGSNGVVVAIGGKKNPGVLTANQALVANATSGIDKIITANAVIQKVYANGSHGSTGYLLAVDSGGNTFWQDPNQLTTAAAGSNGQIQFNGGSNDLTASDGLVFTVASNTLSVGNTILTTTVNAATFAVGTSTVSNATGVYTVGVVNAASHTVGSNFVANSVGITTAGYANVATTLAAGNTTVTGFVNVTSDSASLRVGNTTNFISGNTTGLYPASNSAGQALGSGSQRWAIFASSASISGTVSGITTLAAGNTTITGFVNASASVNSAILSVGTAVIANATGVWTTGTTNAAVVSVGTNFIANTTQVTASVPAVFNGNVTLGDANTDTVTFNAEVASNIVPSANVTYNLGSINDRFNYVYAANVHSSRGYFEGRVDILGDLVVTGNVTTINVSSLQVQDPLIYLAGNNTATDLVDIGFVGTYYDGATQRHAGIFRKAATDKFFLFKGYTQKPDNNVIDVGNTSLGYAVAELQAYLDSGALKSNSSAVTVTANSTVAVNITANSITLTTPLATTSGGTGFNTYTSGDLLVANTGNSLSKLGLGTDGQVLQSNGTALVYAGLDGGTF